jgi:DNA invertase Pin-like site-specific DNA recombinase
VTNRVYNNFKYGDVKIATASSIHRISKTFEPAKQRAKIYRQWQHDRDPPQKERRSMHDAISYKRFSTQRQGRGDSDRRQSDLTEEYCRRNDLKLIDTYLDSGLSGFTGENLNDGSALTALLYAAKGGRFRPGTRLIVESLDRLSRREITTAVRLFLDILDTGLVIITLIDGDQVFTKERVDSDLTALIIAIVYLARANNESKNRRERALQAQKIARRKARERKIPITAECPAWLTVVGKGDARHFVVDDERARAVQQIFKMAVEGMGQYQITSFLNRHHVATFSGSRHGGLG